MFFVKYNDPIYVKLEKLDIMIRLTTETNIATVLSELKEYDCVCTWCALFTVCDASGILLRLMWTL